MTIYWLKDLISGRKKRIKNNEVKHIAVPQYEGLGIKEMTTFLQDHQQVAQWLPDMQEIPRLPKDFLANVAFTVVQGPFGNWVKQMITARNAKLATDQQLNIEVDPELADAFQNSTSVSSKYQIYLHMKIHGCCNVNTYEWSS